jgi:hypothetical protein
MISAEVPALLAKACEIFIEELTLYAWIHTDDAKRKTLQVGYMGFNEFFFVILKSFQLKHFFCLAKRRRTCRWQL